MTEFSLTVVTPDGEKFSGMAQELIVRTVSGDMGILAGHTDCVAPLGMGRAMVVTAEGRKEAACMGGILTVADGKVTLVPTTFEWAEEIDGDRAQRAVKKAKATLEKKDSLSEQELRIAEAKLKRALVRSSIRK